MALIHIMDAVLIAFYHNNDVSLENRSMPCKLLGLIKTFVGLEKQYRLQFSLSSEWIRIKSAILI